MKGPLFLNYHPILKSLLRRELIYYLCGSEERHRQPGIYGSRVLLVMWFNQIPHRIKLIGVMFKDHVLNFVMCPYFIHFTS